MTANPSRAALPLWQSGWWRGRPYGSDDGAAMSSVVGYGVLEVDLLGQPIAQLWAWLPSADTGEDAAQEVGTWDGQVWLRFDSIEGVVDHILRTGDQTIVVSSTVPTAECAAVFADAASHQRSDMPDSFLAACFTALAASAPDLALAPATASDAAEVEAAHMYSAGRTLPEGPWQAVDLVGYLEALVVAEAFGIAGEDSESAS